MNRMSDLISRQAVIDALYAFWSDSSFDGEGHDIADKSEDVLSELPSAKPEGDKMAEIQIIMKQEKRPCFIYLDGEKWHCLWHMFHDGKAFIEYDDGTTDWVHADEVTFLDSKEQFKDYDWEEGL